MFNQPTLTIAIPSYSRPADLNYLLETIYEGDQWPDEIVVADDNSPDQQLVTEVVNRWRDRFLRKNVKFVYLENDTNVGYDRNLKLLLGVSSSEFVVFIGNDDAFTRAGIVEIRRALERRPGIVAFSRAFVKFSGTLDDFRGISRFATTDCVFSPGGSNPKLYLRLCAYFGGLVVDRQWAIAKETEKYDGTLYYQLYLFGCAYYETGIGYIAEPVVGARVDGVPLFGSSPTESGAHKPGGYAAEARANMWRSILRIATDLDAMYGSRSAEEIHYELQTRFSFHVFEGYADRSIGELFALVRELNGLALMKHPVPVALFLLVLVLRRHSAVAFRLVRRIYQR
jgi:glycosyltransferase involved in cell wall biosynthesis